MKIFDTLSGTKKELTQPAARPLNLFVCGPTVYDYPHIGNLRSFLAFDMIVRYLRSRGFNIFYLQNITDIDDKIIQRAQDEGVSWQEISKKYTDIFYQNLKQLNITSVNEYARATDFIPQIIAQVQTLINRGHAYKIDGDGWYFDLTTYPDYGQLARRTVQQAEDGVSRVDVSEKKKNAGDFCLWKLTTHNTQRTTEPSWPASELGDGRPGWHIEDTAITEHFFGPQYDLHGGGIDLKFPHHEAERAQQESASGKKPFVQIWMHAGHLLIDEKKMSKSLGNFTILDDLLKKITTDEFRLMLLMHHYRSPLDYTAQLTHAAKKNLADLNTLIAKLTLLKNNEQKTKNNLEIEKYEKQFHEVMDDDLNTPKALAVIFDLVSETNKVIWKLSTDEARAITKFLETTFQAFGITLSPPPIPPDVVQLVHSRELSRANKQFAQSDALRARVESLGYGIEDTPSGPLILPKQ